jgi:moderate conductance mechanosensitive channel
VTTAAFDQPDVRALAGHFEATVVTLVAAFLLWRIALAVIDRFFARRFVSRYMPRVATFSTLAKSIVGLVILAAGTLELLNVWAVNTTPAVWSAGFITAALAFGSQTIVRDIVTGFFFLFEDQYDVGDRVELVTAGGQTVVGSVEAMGLRTTKVVDRQGRYVVVPNGNIALVTNASRLPSKAGFSIAVPWKDDAMAMRDRIANYVREISAAAGKQDSRFTVSLADSTLDGATYRVEMQSADAESDLEQTNLRERLVARLQTDGWLPGHKESH